MLRAVVRNFLDFLRKSIIAVGFLTKYYINLNEVGHRLYCKIKDLRYGTQFSKTDIDFFRTAYADPALIKRKINRNSFGYQYLGVGRIVTGEFPSAAIDFENYYVYTSLYEHFVNGRDWSETAYYTMAFDLLDAFDLGWSQIPDPASLDAFFEELDQLYQSIRSNGYLARKELKSESESPIVNAILGPIQSHSEVFIDIGRDGGLLLTDGRHRLAIAKILSLESIPVRILSRHRKWCEFRNELLDWITEDGVAVSKYPIRHPEFSHIKSRYDPVTIAEQVKEKTDPSDGPIVEYDPGVSGELLCELARSGYKIIAIIESDDQQQFLEWYAGFMRAPLETKLISNLDNWENRCSLITLDQDNFKQAIDNIDFSNFDRILSPNSEPIQQKSEDIELVGFNLPTSSKNQRESHQQR